MTIFQNVRKGLIPARLTVDEVYALQDAGILSEHDHWELIEGEIVPMAAAKANWHSLMEAKLNGAIVPQLPANCRLHPAPSIALAIGTLVEPDLAVLPKGRMPRDLRGPDLLLVIEVADSSLAYDLRVKAPLYAQHGVRDYWVVDAVRQTIRIHRAPVDGFYTDVEEYEAHDSVSALLLPGVAVKLDTME